LTDDNGKVVALVAEVTLTPVLSVD
jgi:hypothetical protein